MATVRMWSKESLGVPGQPETPILRGDPVLVTDTFQDEQGVWCYSITTQSGVVFTVACCHLRKTEPTQPPPSDALEVTSKRGIYNAQN